MKWCFLGSEVAMCRTDLRRTGENEMGVDKRAGGFREAARAKLKTDDVMVILVIPRDGFGAVREGLPSPE